MELTPKLTISTPRRSRQSAERTSLSARASSVVWPGNGAVANAHLRDLGKGGLQSGEQLGLKLAVDLIARVAIGHVAAHVGVEQQRVGDAVRILAVAANGDVDVQANVVIDHAEGHGRGGAVLVTDDLLGVDEVDTLVLACVAAKR